MNIIEDGIIEILHLFPIFLAYIQIGFDLIALFYRFVKTWKC